jgi:quinolinate synthase
MTIHTLPSLTPTMPPELEPHVSAVEWPLMAPLVAEITQLKKERDAVILAHNYMKPEIFHCVADITGDSLALAQRAIDTTASVIVMAGVHFMAETAKVLNPQKTVLMPDLKAGCSLAEAITAEDVRRMKAEYPGLPVVVYVNTSAEVKAEADVCCTSGNAVQVVESICAEWGVSRCLFLPDRYLAQNVGALTEIEVIPFPGACEVHEQYTPEDIADIRDSFDNDLVVIAHPECPRPVVEAADFAGSTAQMVDYIRQQSPTRVLLVTECSMGENLMAAAPQTEFVRACNLCPHMKRITLEKIRDSLRSLEPRIEVDPAIADRARLSVERMLACGRNGKIG